MKITRRLKNAGLLPKILLAILSGVVCSLFFPGWAVRIFTTFNGLFGNFLGFTIPLIILGLVAPGIAETGRSAGKLLAFTAILAYGSTVLSGLLAYFSCRLSFPFLLSGSGEWTPAIEPAAAARYDPWFTVQMPPVMDIMTALLLAFVLGLGLARLPSGRFKEVLNEFREVVTLVISKAIIPLLPLYIFGIFLRMGAEDQMGSVLSVFARIILLIFVLHVLLLVLQFTLAGWYTGKNPLRLLRNMLPAYMTALGTQSSAATIPVTLRQSLKNGVNPELAGFVIPLCATIHLSGSTLKIVSCAMAILYMSGSETPFPLLAGFVMMLGVTMVAAPGVPGGAIMAALGVLQTMLGFDEPMLGLMIALYITMDSFGTACNVTGDGAIAVVMEKIEEKLIKT